MTTETTAQPTPGPWEIDGYNMAAVIRKVSDAGSAGTWETIARFEGPNWRANALLGRAAPDLLDNLHALIGILDGDIRGYVKNALTEARAAIAKAEGLDSRPPINPAKGDAL